MFHLGESQELYVVKEVGFGIYLGEDENATEKVLLPKKEVPEGIKAGDILEVFLYKDSQDRLIATTRTPKVRLGETAVLRVADTGKIGAFLDWGLEKDLFLPYKEMIGKVKAGSDGAVVIKGLKMGDYRVTETKAPEGYSINVDGASATIKESKDKNVTVPTSLKDTKLSALPSTGGIGTTIFTIAGCLIMVTAAGLFFASRKRTNK